MVFFCYFGTPGVGKWRQISIFSISFFGGLGDAWWKRALMSLKFFLPRNFKKPEKQATFQFLAFFFIILQRKGLNITIIFFLPWALQEVGLHCWAVKIVYAPLRKTRVLEEKCKKISVKNCILWNPKNAFLGVPPPRPIGCNFSFCSIERKNAKSRPPQIHWTRNRDGLQAFWDISYKLPNLDVFPTIHLKGCKNPLSSLLLLPL